MDKDDKTTPEFQLDKKTGLYLPVGVRKGTVPIGFQIKKS